MSRERFLHAPIHLSGADPPPLPEVVKDACARSAPLAQLVGATALGVTAAYFAPMFFDWALSRFRDDESDEIELDFE